MPGARVASDDRVTLRTAEEEDVPFLQRAHANPELRHMLGWDVKNQAQLEDELTENLGHDELFVVCLDEDGADSGQPEAGDVHRIGAIVAGTHERARSGIGFWLVPAVHGEGYGTEAVSLALDHLFHDYPAPAIHASALPHNDASRGLLETLGFVQEGRSRKVAFWDGDYRDAIEYSLLREEWRDQD
jgi:ribosomal-protein-alanine N-acetyltransferase